MASPNGNLNSPETYTERGEAVRARGNVLYSEVAGGGGGNVASKRSKLQRAQQHYNEALELSYNSEARASCCKNLGALHFLWGKVELETVPSWNGGGAGRQAAGLPNNTISACAQHLSQAVSFFVRAHVEGARAKKSPAWMQHVAKSAAGVVEWAAEQSKILEFPEAPIMQRLCDDLEKLGRENLAFKVEAEALANVELAECLFKPSPVRSTRGGCKVMSYKPLDRASELLDSLPPSSTKATLQRRVSLLRPSAESIFAPETFATFFGGGQMYGASS